jgi:hypothetical protein
MKVSGNPIGKMMDAHYPLFPATSLGQLNLFTIYYMW